METAELLKGLDELAAGHPHGDVAMWAHDAAERIRELRDQLMEGEIDRVKSDGELFSATIFRDEIATEFVKSVFQKAASADDVITHRQGMAAAAYAIADAVLAARDADNA